MPNKRFLIPARLFVVLFVFAGAVGVWLYFTRPVATVVRAVRGSAIDAVPGSVLVDAQYQMDIKSETGGRIIKTALDEGKQVKEGDFLAQLDTGDLKLQLDKTQSDYDALKKRIDVGSQIQLELESAQASFANMERLHKRGQISDNDFENQHRALQQIQQRRDLEKVDNQNQLENYENALKTLQRQIDKMTIVAPFDGVVSQVLARTGDLIGGGAPIATLIATSRTVRANISEENFAGIQVGQKASVRFLTYGNQLYDASVSKILPTADPATQRYVVFLKVDIPLEQLKPGLTGEASIVVGKHDNALIVPRRALSGDKLFVVKNGRVQLRTVSLGYVGLNEAEILTGVDEGEAVITEELDRFNDGARVRTAFLPQ